MTDIYVKDSDLRILIEIARLPEDCLLNHKVSKALLKRLLDSNLIEVETRRCVPWHREPDTSCMDNVQRLRTYEDWGRMMRSKFWGERTEIHARLTDVGVAYMAEYRKRLLIVGP